MFGLTEGEAANVSILLHEIWRTVSKWRYDEDAFKSELSGKTGSQMIETNGNGEKVEPVSHKKFTELYNRWHAAIGSTCLGCLQSKEYIHPRNALIVLTRIVEIYPTRPGLANKLLSGLQPMQDERYPFADLRASAQAYSTQLVKARDEGVWKEETSEAREARVAEEQAAAAARQRKAEEQMEQLKRDTQKITDEIGEKESWGRDRRAPARGPSRGQGQDDSWRSDPKTSNPGKERSDGHRESTGPSRGGGDAWPRDRAGVGSSPAVSRRDQGGDDSRRNLDGRWQKAPAADNGGRGAKRSRPPSPADPGEIQEEGSRNKRPRQDAGPDERGNNYRRRRRN
uniref:THO complex subunitTHOC2 C-terminal domain-containing protein n=1 Tax=Entomoneis paludosa TaxID=265537 RepID=A0A7S2YR28_9STRA